MLGTKVWVATAEDTVLAKLEWSKQSGSSRQIEDARGIFEMQGAALDMKYLHEWARELDVQEQLASRLPGTLRADWRFNTFRRQRVCEGNCAQRRGMDDGPERRTSAGSWSAQRGARRAGAGAEG